MSEEQNKQILSDRLLRVINLVMLGALVPVAIVAGMTSNWSVLFASLGTVGLAVIVKQLASQINVRLPLQFEFAIIVFLYMSVFLGEAGDYYERFWWWDGVLHAGSGFAFGFAGFLILYLMYARKRITASPFLMATFAFAFGLAIGTLWEVFEFAMDELFGFQMQNNSLADTMWDLIVDSIGAGIASLVGYIYLKHRVWDPFDAFISWFVDANPRYRRHIKSLTKRL